MLDFKKQEPEILDFWEQDQTFQKSLQQKAPQGDYLFYDGPPFATGLPHYGHLVASIMKDVVPRFWTMRGYRVERRWGWDCHGLPIENIVEKELGFKNKKDIVKLGVAKFNEICRSKVLEFADAWVGTIRRLGRWVDMEHSYRTMDPEFMESVWWVFKQLWDRELIYKDYRSMHICPRCETTLSQSEVAEGYRDIKDLSLVAKFELVEEPGTFFLAWTTTPWTLIGNVALAVGADLDYVKIICGQQKYILAKALWENYARELGDDPEILAEFKGRTLVGKKYKPLFDYYAADAKLANRKNGWQIYNADFVSTEEGTGIVHIAPAFGEDDMRLGREKSLPFVQHVNMDGTIRAEASDFAELNVKPKDDVQSTDILIIKYLANKGLLFAKEKYEHSYPHCWRCDTPLLNYATTSWFVAVTKIKDKLLSTAEKIDWTPEHIKDGRFGKWLEGARDWSISRQRFWASVIPIWQCDKCEQLRVFGSVAELSQASGQEINDLHKNVVDEITIPCHCGATMHRIPDVLDTWFDSGSMPYAQAHYPFENKDSFDNKFPARFIAEGTDQTRAWFYYLHVIAGAIKDSPAYQNVIVNGIVLAEDGKKMSKKLSNYPEPDIVMEKYGADALRLYLLSSPVMLAENLSFVEKDLSTVFRRFTVILQNVLNFYLMFGDKKLPTLPETLNNHLDKWIIAKYFLLWREVTQAMEDYNLPKATRPLIDFVDALSTWYVRRSRDRFKSEDQADKEQAASTLAYVLVEFSKVIAPFAPLSAEIIYQQFAGVNTSVHLQSWPQYQESMVDEKVLNQMNVIRDIAERGHALRAKAGIKLRQPLATLQITLQGINLENEYKDILKEEVNVESIELVENLTATDGWVVDESGYVMAKIAIDTNINEELKDKGVVREIIRQINSLRKEAGLQPSDSPTETYQTHSTYLKKVISKYKAEIVSNTSAGDFIESGQFTHCKEAKIEAEEIILGIQS
ncbi:MAG: isoleucine--tRNA ligase [Parcubacteria group bacterium]|nr:MAG: isoleucine--tRNA ligase [Parcubacteria group bacterium]